MGFPKDLEEFTRKPGKGSPCPWLSPAEQAPSESRQARASVPKWKGASNIPSELLQTDASQSLWITCPARTTC